VIGAARGAVGRPGEGKSAAKTDPTANHRRWRDCTLVNPWPGKAVVVYRSGKKVETFQGERIVMKTKAGETVVFRPEGAGWPIRE